MLLKMKNTLLILLILPVLSIKLDGQKPILDYQDAVIVKKNKDSVICKIQLLQVSEKELDPWGEVSVIYKIGGNPEKQSMKVNEIQSIKLSYSTYLNIPVDKRELLFKVAVKGKVLLLEFPEISIIPNGGIEKFGPKKVKYYAIKTDDNVAVIKVKRDLIKFNDIIENCPEAKDLVSKKSFKLDDLELLVTKLNECK